MLARRTRKLASRSRAGLVPKKAEHKRLTTIKKQGKPETPSRRFGAGAIPGLLGALPRLASATKCL